LSTKRLIEPESVVPKSIGRFDETLGWALKPNSSAWPSATGEPVLYSINAKASRDAETDYEPSGTFRTLLLGDPRTFGYGGYFQQVEVINLGVSVCGVDQEPLALRGEGLRYHPDIVIAYVAHFGDQRHTYSDRWGKPKPRFVLRDGELVLTNVPVPSEYEGLDVAHLADLFPVSHSPLYREASKAGIGLLKRAIGRADPARRPPMRKFDPVFVDQMYEQTVAILQQLDRGAAAAGATCSSPNFPGCIASVRRLEFRRSMLRSRSKIRCSNFPTASTHQRGRKRRTRMGGHSLPERDWPDLDHAPRQRCAGLSRFVMMRRPR